MLTLVKVKPGRFPVFVKFDEEAEPLFLKRLFDDVGLGDILFLKCAVDVFPLTVFPLAVHISIRVDAGQYEEVEVLQEVCEVPSQKMQDGFGTGRFISMRPRGHQDVLRLPRFSPRRTRCTG